MAFAERYFHRTRDRSISQVAVKWTLIKKHSSCHILHALDISFKAAQKKRGQKCKPWWKNSNVGTSRDERIWANLFHRCCNCWLYWNSTTMPSLCVWETVSTSTSSCSWKSAFSQDTHSVRTRIQSGHTFSQDTVSVILLSLVVHHW